MLGKLSWAAIPLDQPIPMIASGVVGLVIIGVLAWVTLKGWLPYLWREWITSVDHKRIGIMYILLAAVMLLRGFSDAIMMRSQQALAFIDQGNVDVFQVFRGRVVKGRRRIGGAWRERCEQETSRNAGAHSRPCASYLVIDDICGALFDLCAQILVVRVVETKPPLLDLKPSIKLVYFGLCEALGVFHGKHSLLFLSSGACCARRSAGSLRARRSAISPLNGSPR